MRIAYKNLLAFVATAALASCTTSGPGPGGTTGGGPGSVSEPTTVGHFEAAGKPLKYPMRIATDGSMVYTTDNLNNQVVAYKGGQPAWTLAGLDKPLGIAVAGDKMFVGNAGRRDVEVYSISQFKFLYSLGGVGAFVMPNAIAVQAEKVYVVDSRQNVVRVFTVDGAQAGELRGDFNFPIDVAADGKRIVVADQGNHRVVVFNNAGQVNYSFGSEVQNGNSRTAYEGHFTSIGGIALVDDKILVLDSAHSYVQVLDAAGGFVGFMGTAGDCATCMRMGLDLAVDSAGKVLVTDPENRRWVSLSPEMR